MQRVAAGAAVVFAGDAARLERVGGDAVDDEALLDHVGGLGEGGVGRGLVAGLVEIGLVVRAIVVELRRAGLERLARRHHRGARRVVDLDALGGVAGKLQRVGDHDRDRIADMQHAVDRDRRPVRQVHRAAVALLVGRHRRHRAEAVGVVVLAGQHRMHARHLQRGARVDALDVGMGVRRAHDRGVELIGKLEVVVVAPASHQQARVLAPPHRLTDREFTHERPAPLDSERQSNRQRLRSRHRPRMRDGPVHLSARGPQHARKRRRHRMDAASRDGNVMRTAALALCLGLGLIAGGRDRARAQTDDYPSRTVTFICPFPAGGGTDILVRLLAAELAGQAQAAGHRRQPGRRRHA